MRVLRVIRDVANVSYKSYANLYPQLLDSYRLMVLIAAFGARCVVGVDGWLAIMAPWNPRRHVDHD